MKIKEVLSLLNKISPFELQEKWDNSGLIIGDENREIKEIVVSLDIDINLIEKAKEKTLFIVHHPLIFGKISELDFKKYPANLIEKLILKRQSLIAMHTNFDKTHLNRYVFENILNFKINIEQEFILTTNKNFKFNELISYLKEKLNLKYIRVVGKKEEINSIALTTGAGVSLLDEVNADCFLTGDIKYHDGMKALSEGKTLIDIGHYESEIFFNQIIAKELQNLNLLVIMINSQNPFETL